MFLSIVLLIGILLEKLKKQLLFLAESVFEKTVNKDYEKAMKKLEEAMKVTIPALSNYADFVYSDMEVRILMNISLILKKQKILKKVLK